MITTFDTDSSRTKVQPAKRPRALAAHLRRPLLAAAAMACTLLASANTPVQPERMTAPPPPHTAAPHAQPFATDRYVKGATRPRFAVPSGQVRAPHVDAMDYTVGSPSELAKALPASSGASGLNTLPAPTAADLAPTDEVVFTPAITDLATSLNHNPVAIYNWVRDHIVFVPTYGSVQGADATLATHRGNAFDTASLLIPLLRTTGSATWLCLTRRSRCSRKAASRCRACSAAAALRRSASNMCGSKRTSTSIPHAAASKTPRPRGPRSTPATSSTTTVPA